MTQLGLGASYLHDHDRSREEDRTTLFDTVDIIECDGYHWLVVGFGPTNWVRDARAAGEVTLGRGRRWSDSTSTGWRA
jgi:hypothetical protein